MTKEGYQPLKTKKTLKIIPPNTGSHIKMKKNGYTWEDLDRSYWRGFDTAKNNMEKRIAELEKENAELKEKNNNLVASSKTIISLSNGIENRTMEQLTKAKGIIKDQKKLLDSVLAGAETLSDFAHNTLRKAEQFISEVEK